MTTAEERYEETWNNYLVLLNKDPNVSLASFTKSKNVYHRGMTKWMSRNGLSVLSGVSLTFPDGTIVNIKRGSAKALVSFLSLYRKGGEPCLG